MPKKNDMDHMKSILGHAASRPPAAQPRPLPRVISGDASPTKAMPLPRVTSPGAPPTKPMPFGKGR